MANSLKLYDYVKWKMSAHQIILFAFLRHGVLLTTVKVTVECDRVRVLGQSTRHLSGNDNNSEFTKTKY